MTYPLCYGAPKKVYKLTLILDLVMTCLKLLTLGLCCAGVVHDLASPTPIPWHFFVNYTQCDQMWAFVTILVIFRMLWQFIPLKIAKNWCFDVYVLAFEKFIFVPWWQIWGFSPKCWWLFHLNTGHTDYTSVFYFNAFLSGMFIFPLPVKQVTNFIRRKNTGKVFVFVFNSILGPFSLTVVKL